MNRHLRVSTGAVIGVLFTLGAAGAAFAQDPPPAQQGQAQRGARPQGPRGGGARAVLPPPGPNMTVQQLQDYLDVAAVIQAERRLQLSTEQYPNFVARLRKLQQIRRQHLMQFRKALADLRPLAAGDGPYQDAVITE